MFDWPRLRLASSDCERPAPFHLQWEILQDVKEHPEAISEIVDTLLDTVCANKVNSSLKALLLIKHIARKVTPFRCFLRTHRKAALSRLGSSSGVFGQTVVEVLSLLDSEDGDLEISNLSVEKRISGFGSFASPVLERSSGSTVSDFFSEISNDLKERGPLGTVRMAVVDVADFVGEGLTAVGSWLRDRPEISRSDLTQSRSKTQPDLLE